MVVSLTRRVALAAAAVAALFIVAILLLSFANARLEGRISAGRASLPMIRAADAITGTVTAADEALEDYVDAPRREALIGINNARDRIPVLVARVQAAEDENPLQTARAGALRTSAMEYRDQYLLPLAQAAAQGDRSAEQSVLAGEGRQRVVEIRDAAEELVGALRQGVNRRAAEAQSRANLARTGAWGAGLVALLSLGGLVVFLARSVAEPLRRAAAAAMALGEGDLSVRLEEANRRDELGLLARAFNTMAQSLQRSNRELKCVSDSLEVAHENQAQFAAMAEALARASTLEERAAVLLARTADHIHASAGTVYGRPVLDASTHELLAARAVDQATLPEVLSTGGSTAERAIAERRTLRDEHSAGALVIHAFGQPLSIRHEIHVPMTHGDEVLGLLSLGRAGDEPFTDAEVRILERQAAQGAVAFENALEAVHGRRLADLNRAVLDSTAEGILLIGNDGQTVISNPALRQIVSEVIGADPDERDFAQLAQRVIAEVVDAEGAQAFFELLQADPLAARSYEYQLKESGRWIHSYIAPVQTASGEHLGRVAVLREVTEQRQAEQVKDELMATVSHELRTPLSAILGFSELLRARDYPAEERKEYIDTVHEQAVRLSRLINDFLDLQRLQHSQSGLEKRPLDLAKLLGDEAALYDRQSALHEVAFNGPAEEFSVRADAERLRRLIGNLLSNAIKYSPDGGRVDVELHRDGDEAVVIVCDDGIGVPSSARSQIFDRFYRVDNSSTRRIGGTGLGLALVREIAEAHGGSVGYDSVEGKGSRFWFRIPTALACISADLSIVGTRCVRSATFNRWDTHH